MNLRARLSTQHIDTVLAGVLGAALFLFRIGPRVLAPGSVNWLYGQSDSAMFQIGWEFFRSEPWQFPLGRISGYLAPHGTTIALTDSLPLLAIPLKAIAFLLPTDFQYFGFWLLCCYVLQGVFAYLLASRLATVRWLRFSGALLLLLCPVFLIRDGHIALTGHWVLLAALWLYCRTSTPATAPAAAGWLRRLRPWLVLQAVVCTVHFYLAVMVFGIALTAAIRDRLVVRRHAARFGWLEPAVLASTAMGVWYLAGYLKFGELTRYAGSFYGRSAMAIDSFWNPLDQSLLLGGRPHPTSNALEAFSYLGLGLIAALIVTLIGLLTVLRKDRIWRRLARHWPLLLLSVAWGVFALGNEVALGDRILFRYTLPEALAPLVNPFRACSRFVWPLFYVLLVAVLVVAQRVREVAPRGRHWLAFALPVCLVLQIVDLAPLLDRKAHYRSLRFETRLHDPQWAAAMGHVDRILSYPPRMKHTVMPDDFQDLALLALRHGVSTTAGYTARDFRGDVVAGVDQMQELIYGAPDPRAAYVMRNSYFAARFHRMVDSFNCTDLDGFPVCFSKDCDFEPRRSYHLETTRLAEYVSRHTAQTLILVVKDEATMRLDPGFVRLMQARGSRIGELKYGGSYVGVIVRGEIVFEAVQAQQDVEVEGDIGSHIGPVRIGKALRAISGGHRAGDLASLTINGREVLFNHRGFNVAVLDDRQNVLEIAIFDTHREEQGYAFTLRQATVDHDDNR